eukprot:m.282235 g.282235  ORF g.282235 m.282235 type:complete len:505 (-) comp19845_c0_seq9:718-2232(-)
MPLVTQDFAKRAVDSTSVRVCFWDLPSILEVISPITVLSILFLLADSVQCKPQGPHDVFKTTPLFVVRTHGGDESDQADEILNHNVAEIKASISPKDFFVVPWQPPEVLPPPFENGVARTSLHSRGRVTSLQTDTYERQTADNLVYLPHERSLLATYRHVAEGIVQLFDERKQNSSNPSDASPFRYAILMHDTIKMTPGLSKIIHREILHSAPPPNEWHVLQWFTANPHARAQFRQVLESWVKWMPEYYGSYFTVISVEGARILATKEVRFHAAPDFWLMSSEGGTSTLNTYTHTRNWFTRLPYTHRRRHANGLGINIDETTDTVIGTFGLEPKFPENAKPPPVSVTFVTSSFKSATVPRPLTNAMFPDFILPTLYHFRSADDTTRYCKLQFWRQLPKPTTAWILFYDMDIQFDGFPWMTLFNAIQDNHGMIGLTRESYRQNTETMYTDPDYHADRSVADCTVLSDTVSRSLCVCFRAWVFLSVSECVFVSSVCMCVRLIRSRA